MRLQALYISAFLISTTYCLLIKISDGWKYTEIHLEGPITSDNLNSWLQKNGLYLYPEKLSFKEATLKELEYLPFEFYRKYASVDQFRQVLKILDKHTEQVGFDDFLENVRKLANTKIINSNRDAERQVNPENPWMIDSSESKRRLGRDWEDDSENASIITNSEEHSSASASYENNKDSSSSELMFFLEDDK